MSQIVRETKKGNPFAALVGLDSDDDDASPPPAPVAPPPSPPPVSTPAPTRQWILSPGEPSPPNPFSRGRKGRPQERRVDDGWTSITWNKPQFVDDDSDDEKKIKEEIVAEALPSSPKEEEVPSMAKAWAEKVKASLEKAEKKKPELSDDFIASLGKLSFFRRPLVPN